MHVHVICGGAFHGFSYRGAAAYRSAACVWTTGCVRSRTWRRCDIDAGADRRRSHCWELRGNAASDMVWSPLLLHEWWGIKTQGEHGFIPISKSKRHGYLAMGILPKGHHELKGTVDVANSSHIVHAQAPCTVMLYRALPYPL
jgi:hypothetical protein